jgi:RNA polymerase primary sigma factor
VQSLGREPIPEEVAAELQWSTRDVKEIMRFAQVPVSLEKPIGEEDDSSLGDFVEDDQAPSPFETAQENMQREDVRLVLDALPPREREVIEMRYGLKDGQPKTLEEVGRAFKVTRERIRQIETRTLARLRHPTKIRKLEDLIE